jgi:hypothetical protein
VRTPGSGGFELRLDEIRSRERMKGICHAQS